MFGLLRRHQIVTSAQMLAELVDALSREEFSDTKESQASQFLSILTRNAILVTPSKLFKAVQEDPDDDVVLGTAHEGRASYIVSGDSIS